ncbi:hypothetical protein [Azospirillum sp. B506]|uniref:hypothetical protein n=1 Tax=Azospirillum sp. B506 TaxID=137721 RepID=UPI0011DE1112|nr:hypothetical protein [Azospirillum sp. B506]
MILPADTRHTRSVHRLVRLCLSIALNFSTLPLRLGAFLGIAIMAGGALLGGALLVRHLFLDRPVTGGAGRSREHAWEATVGHGQCGKAIRS